MALKNYSTKVPAIRTVGEVQELLAKHGANRVSIEYGDGGKVLGVVFAINDASGAHVFRLPARSDRVMALLEKQGVKCSEEHAEAVAWRNVKDWIDAQLAMVETGQVDAAEVMMPYMLDDSGHTLYEAFAGKMLEKGRS